MDWSSLFDQSYVEHNPMQNQLFITLAIESSLDPGLDHRGDTETQWGLLLTDIGPETNLTSELNNVFSLKIFK